MYFKENYLLKKRKDEDSDISESDSDEDSDRDRSSSSYKDKLKKRYEKLLEKKERKRLLELKRQLVNKPKRPKLLNLEDYEVDTSNLDDDKESDYPDIRDIEFKLMHNLNEVQV